MPFSSVHNVLFVHIPRTGGTSIETILDMRRPRQPVDMTVLHGWITIGFQEYSAQHLSCLESLQFIARDLGPKLFKFSFVRNPWERLVSEYHWQGGADRLGDFSAFVKSAAGIVERRDDLEGRNNHLRPQVEFLDHRMDFIGRFENFEADLRVLLERIHVGGVQIPHIYQTTRRYYAEYYDDDSRAIVSRIYRHDIEAYQYAFDVNDPSNRID
jgi:hypothetical protein